MADEDEGRAQKQEVEQRNQQPNRCEKARLPLENNDVWFILLDLTKSYNPGDWI